MSDIEIEIQVQIEHEKPLIAFLGKHGDYKGQRRQIDQYFNHPRRDFLAVRPVVEWLRLRDAEGKHSINYKRWHYDKNGRGTFADEYESPIEDLAAFEKIFKALGFKSLVVVDKLRKTWRYKEYEVVLDSVKGLGEFVEIEYKGSKKVNAAAVTTGMLEFLKSVGCGKIVQNHAGYPYQMLLPGEIKLEVIE